MFVGLFDGLVQGCIPVVFNGQTANTMYTWHWPETFWDEELIVFLFLFLLFTAFYFCLFDGYELLILKYLHSILHIGYNSNRNSESCS